MFHILGDCYLQKKPDILVCRPSSQNVEKLQFINYFLFRMEINRRRTSWLRVTCLGTASRTERVLKILFCFATDGKDRRSYVIVLLIYGRTSPFPLNTDKTWMTRLEAMGCSFPASRSHV